MIPENIDVQKAMIGMILECTVEAFNQNHTSTQMEKDLFVDGYPLYLATPPYKRYCEVCITLCAEINEREAIRRSARWSYAASGYDTNWDMESVRARVKKSLETNHPETRRVYNSIEALAKRKGIELPELIVKTGKYIEQSSELEIESTTRSSAPLGEKRKLSYYEIPRAERTVKPSRDMNGAAQFAVTTRAPRKSRTPINAEPHEIMTLTPMRLQETMVKICAEEGAGRATVPEIVSKGFATSETRSVRAWIAYVGERCLPKSKYPLKRLASTANMEEIETMRAIKTIREKVESKDPDTLRVLTAIPAKIPLSRHQQKLLINPGLSRFNEWTDVIELEAKAPAGRPSPEGP